MLVRKIVGLDSNAAKSAFSEFLAEGQYTADQIQFVNMIIDHLVANGMMKPELLFAPPFTDFHSHGIAGILGDDAEKVIAVLRRINTVEVASG